jgi:hypothetical protein
VTAHDRKTDAAEPGARSVKRRFENLARKPYVQGLPEWHLFPNDESRRKAIESIERHMMPRSIKGVLQFLLAVALFLSVPIGVSYLVTQMLPSLGPWNDRLLWILSLCGYRDRVPAIRQQPKALRLHL